MSSRQIHRKSRPQGLLPRSAGSTSTDVITAMQVVFRLQGTALVLMDPRDTSGRRWRRTGHLGADSMEFTEAS